MNSSTYFLVLLVVAFIACAHAQRNFETLSSVKSSIVHRDTLNFIGGVEDLKNTPFGSSSGPDVYDSPMHPPMLQTVTSSIRPADTTSPTESSDADFWQKGGRDLTPNRVFYSNTHADRYDYVYGGKFDDGTVTDEFWRYDKDFHFWEQLSVPTNGCTPPELYGHCSVLDGTWLVMLGGSTQDSGFNEDIYRINLENMDFGWNCTLKSDWTPVDDYHRIHSMCFFGDADGHENVVYQVFGEFADGDPSYDVIAIQTSDNNGDPIDDANVSIVFEQDFSLVLGGLPFAGNNAAIGMDGDVWHDLNNDVTYYVYTGGYWLNTTENNWVSVDTDEFIVGINIDDTFNTDITFDGSFGQPSADTDSQLTPRGLHVAYEYNFEIYISGGLNRFYDFEGAVFDEEVLSPFCDLWVWDPLNAEDHFLDIPSTIEMYQDGDKPRYVRWPLGYTDGFRQDLGSFFSASTEFATSTQLPGTNLALHLLTSSEPVLLSDLFSLNEGKSWNVFPDFTFSNGGSGSSKRSTRLLVEEEQNGPFPAEVKLPGRPVFEYETTFITPAGDVRDKLILVNFEEPHNVFPHLKSTHPLCKVQRDPADAVDGWKRSAPPKVDPMYQLFMDPGTDVENFNSCNPGYKTTPADTAPGVSGSQCAWKVLDVNGWVAFPNDGSYPGQGNKQTNSIAGFQRIGNGENFNKRSYLTTIPLIERSAEEEEAIYETLMETAVTLGECSEGLPTDQIAALHIEAETWKTTGAFCQSGSNIRAVSDHQVPGVTGVGENKCECEEEQVICAPNLLKIMGPLRNHFKTCIAEAREQTFVPTTPRDITFDYPAAVGDIEARSARERVERVAPIGSEMCEALNEESNEDQFDCEDSEYDLDTFNIELGTSSGTSMLEKVYRGETCLTYEEWFYLNLGCPLQLNHVIE